MKLKFLERTYNLTLVLILLIVFSSCTLIPCAYYSDLDTFDKTPVVSQMVGNYQLVIDPPSSRPQAQLILKKDSTFILKEVPVGVINVFDSDFEQDDNSLKNIIGTWHISEYDREDKLSVEIKLSQINKKLEDIWTNWKLYKIDNKPVVLIMLGDPDSCEALKFIKKD